MAPWSDEHVLYGDGPGGFLAVPELVPGGRTKEPLTAQAVAELDIAGKCCINALWLDLGPLVTVRGP